MAISLAKRAAGPKYVMKHRSYIPKEHISNKDLGIS